MGYITSNLLPNERVVATGVVHWVVYVAGFFALLIALFIFLLSFKFGGVARGFFQIIAGLTAIGGFLSLLKGWIYFRFTELAITNKRVVAKYGLIRRNTIELLHSKVESFRINQTILGRIFNYGSIAIVGTGGTHDPIHNISSPSTFQRHALSIIEQQNTRPADALS